MLGKTGCNSTQSFATHPLLLPLRISSGGHDVQVSSSVDMLTSMNVTTPVTITTTLSTLTPTKEMLTIVSLTMMMMTCSMAGEHHTTRQQTQIGAGLYAVGRPVQKRNDEDGQIGTIQSLPLERGALFNRFFGEPAHGPPHVAGGASGPIGGCRDESRSDNPDLDLRHVFDRNNRKTDLI